MDTVTLKRGRGKMTLVKSDNLIAIKPSLQGEVAEALSAAPTETMQVDTGMNLGGFQIVQVKGTKAEMEKTLDDLRRHYQIDAGTHVFHTPKSTAPYVPTGTITLRFTPDSTPEQRQEVLDTHHLEILDSRVTQNPDGMTTETFIVRITPASQNSLKVAEDLQHSPVVALAEPDLATPGKLAVFTLPTDEFLKEQWHLQNTGVQFGTSLGLKAGADARVVAAWSRAQSLGSPSCVVAIIDDGFDLSHPDISGNSKVVSPWDFATNTNNPSPKKFHPDPKNGDYHGTACAGVAIGNANRTGVLGAAPNCRLMPVRWSSILSDESIEAWFDYVAAQGAWVVSCSWGAAADHYVLSTRQDEAITRCASQGRGGLGCVIVFAAGNSNHDINDPDGGTVDGFATHPDVIAVAASNSRDARSDYSNFGKEISICAPSSGSGGRGILTSDVRGTYPYQGRTHEAGYEVGDYTKTFGGTSSATPLVAGICALLLSVNPSLTAKQVNRVLERTARRIGDPDSYENGHSIYFGHGCVDADAAIQQAMLGRVPTAAIQPAVNIYPDEQLTKENTALYASEFWGISRHELIAGAAAELLKERAKAEVARLLAPLGNSTLRDIAGWADQIKGHEPNEHDDPDTRQFLINFPNDIHRVWHYVNLPLGVDRYSRETYPTFTRNDDVVQMIGESVRVLQARSNRMSKLNALRWVTHLVGDVHQPIHVGCGYIDPSGGTPKFVADPDVIRQRDLRSDRGGNSIILPVSGNVSLHSYWDSQLVSHGEDHLEENEDAGSEHLEVNMAREVIDELATSELKQRFIAKLLTMVWQERTYRSHDVAVFAEANATPLDKWAEQWAIDSLALARQAYQSLQITRVLNGGRYKVSWEGKAAYDARCKPIVLQQLKTAAQHLADLLNTIWQ